MSKGRILLTRTEAECSDFLEACGRAGLEPVFEPMLTIEYLQNAMLPDLGAFQGIIFTSVHGVRAFARKTNRRDFVIYAVGSSTAEAARQAGFKIVRNEGKTVQELASLIMQHTKTEDFGLLYVRAEDISADLKVILHEKGVLIEEIILYRALKAEKFTQNLLFLIKSGEINALTLFSRRAGEAFCQIVKDAGCLQYVSSMKVLCLSEAVLQSVSVLPFKETLVAQTPDRYGMMKLIENFSINEDQER